MNRAVTFGIYLNGLLWLIASAIELDSDRLVPERFLVTSVGTVLAMVMIILASVASRPSDRPKH